MPTPTRDSVLHDNHSLRLGTGQTPRRLDDGFVEFRIPEADFRVLTKTLYPDLIHPDADRRRAAWKEFRHSPVAEQYFVVRAPKQVKRDTKRGVIIR